MVMNIIALLFFHPNVYVNLIEVTLVKQKKCKI
jgi:hypothetical protein